MPLAVILFLGEVLFFTSCDVFLSAVTSVAGSQRTMVLYGSGVEPWVSGGVSVMWGGWVFSAVWGRI